MMFFKEVHILFIALRVCVCIRNIHSSYYTLQLATTSVEFVNYKCVVSLEEIERDREEDGGCGDR